MSDPNMVDFYGRVARIEKSRAKGLGFEAAGTLGRSHYHKPVKRHRSVLGPVLFLLICGFGLKGAIYHSVGAASYTDRVQRLQAGQGFDALGGWLMQADPVTLFVADQIKAGMARLR
jgi:hypothetical protein